MSRLSPSFILYLLAPLSTSLLLWQYYIMVQYSSSHVLLTSQADSFGPSSHLDAFHPSLVRDFKPWLSKRLGLPTSSRCQLIMIRNNSEIRYLKSEVLPESLYNKARALDNQIRWVANRLPPGRVVTMCFHLGSTPVHSATDSIDHPIYSLAKTDHHLDIVYPNMYFGFGGSLDDWGDFQRKISEEVMKNPFTNRQDKAFWRGTCGSYKYNKARIHLVLAVQNSTMLDVGFSNKCPILDASMAETNKDDEQISQIEEVNRLPSTKFIRSIYMTQYKYLFSMPGSSKGSYSRHMQTALCSNATVFLWDNEFYEFYYSLLRPWLHFIPVSDTTLKERLQWVVEHQEEAELIAARGYKFCMTQLTPSATSVYWFQMFTMHSLLQDYDVKEEEVSEACTCDGKETIGHSACKFC